MCSHAEADTAIFLIYNSMIASGYTNPVVVDTEDTHNYIIPLHVMTGCDHTSGFYGVGKKTVTDRVGKSSEARDLLSSCGESLQLSNEVTAKMTRFCSEICVF